MTMEAPDEQALIDYYLKAPAAVKEWIRDEYAHDLSRERHTAAVVARSAFEVIPAPELTIIGSDWGELIQ